MTSMATPDSDLAVRVETLRSLSEAGAGLLPEAALSNAAEVAVRASERLRHGTAFTVVAIAGATGSGKSSLFNVLVGERVSPVGVTRPTTAHARAAVFGDQSADALLGWLDVRHRHGVEAGGPLDGLVLLDLPDHDSIVEGHRLEVDRLIEMVDLMMWVLDPQKYADEALHHGYLERLSGHGSSMVFVLNQADLVPDEAHPEWTDHATRLLRADGIVDPVVVVTSAATGTGLGDLHGLIRDRIAARDAAVARIDADLKAAVADMGTVPLPPTERRDAAAQDLAAGLADAAGASIVADAIEAGYRHDATRTMGWPFGRWILRFRRHPLRRLTPVAPATDDEAAPPPTAIPIDQPRLQLAVRTYADARTGDVDPAWSRRGREAAAARITELPAALGTRVGTVTHQGVRRPRWWSVFAWLQRALAVIAMAGAGWLALLALLSYLKAPIDDLTPKVGSWPVPTILLLGGAAGGIILALVARGFAAVGARRRASAAKHALEQSLNTVANEYVATPLNDELARWHALARSVAVVAGTRGEQQP